jgi:hypothetical protein
MTTSDEVLEIGISAGLVWEELSINGSVTIASLKKSRNLSEVEVQRAIGWLAREDKIRFEQKGKSVLIGLK